METSEHINKKVKSLLSSAGVNSAPVPIDKIVVANKISVQYAALDGDISGLLYKQGEKAVIGVNGLHATVRQRFTLAHEFAHFILGHKGDFFLDRVILFRSTKSKEANSAQERDANAFAAALLMPEEMVQEEIQKEEYLELDEEAVVGKLARKFEVSTQAMAIRLQKLGLTTI
jgi:Zn-dependent peptidase ImmA (M78 family)